MSSVARSGGTIVDHTLLLPQPFVERIRKQLEEESESFLNALSLKAYKGLRLNSLKVDKLSQPFETIKEIFGLKPVPWCEEGFYYDAGSRPGLHPYHQAGLYYLQEPSAMLPVVMLAPQPGELVLDLSAAPGGKATQIVARMRNQGLLIANEIHPARAKILAENLERWGATNTVVTNESPERLVECFHEVFDRILVDAPCSGEGMFRKDANAIQEWSLDQVAACARRQKHILHSAATMLKPGGRLVYSTCTFAPEENEEQIARFLEAHPEYTLLEEKRIWPHLHPGEGHYVAVLAKRDESANPTREPAPVKPSKERKRNKEKKRADTGSWREPWRQFEQFLDHASLTWKPEQGCPIARGSQLYWLPEHESLKRHVDRLLGLKLLSPGLHLSHIKKGRIEPAHALALAMAPGSIANFVSFAPDQDELQRFLRGETIHISPSDERGFNVEDGWVAVCVDGHALGWGKKVKSVIKNHLPKGLRRFTFNEFD